MDSNNICSTGRWMADWWFNLLNIRHTIVSNNHITTTAIFFPHGANLASQNALFDSSMDAFSWEDNKIEFVPPHVVCKPKHWSLAVSKSKSGGMLKHSNKYDTNCRRWCQCGFDPLDHWNYWNLPVAQMKNSFDLWLGSLGVQNTPPHILQNIAYCLLSGWHGMAL